MIAGVPADPRLARALIDGAGLVGAKRAAEVVAMLSEDVRAPGGDLVAALRSLRADQRAGSWRRQVTRLEEVVAKQGTAGDRDGRGPRRASPMTWRWVWWWPWRTRTGSRASAPARRAT